MTIASFEVPSGFSFQGLVRPFALEGKVAVVTGAAGLLGRQHCLSLAEAGAHVVATDIDLDPCSLVVEEIVAHGREALAAEANITTPSEVQGLRDRVLDRFGRIDILVNNAALNDKVEGRAFKAPVPFEDFPLDDWKAAIEVNLTGTFICCQVFGAEMLKHRSGSIINVASTYGIVGPDQRIYKDSEGRQLLFKSPAYSVTKAAVIGLTKYLATLWGTYGIRVNTLSPGGVKTTQDPFFVDNYCERTPLGRMANPEDYRGAVVYLASDSSSYVTGTNLVVDGGWTAW